MMIHKITAILLFTFLSSITLSAKPVLTKSKYLIAALSEEATGTVSPGTTEYPLVYYPDRNTESALETDYWIIEEQGNDRYAFRNASSLKYIRYDDSAVERTALVLADDLPGDQSALFTLELKKLGNLSYYIIRTVNNPMKVWNKRPQQYESLYPVGIYSGTGSNNECFIFCDSDGNPVVDDSADDSSLLPGIGKTLGAFQHDADSILFDSKTPVVDTQQKEFYLTVPESQIDQMISMNVRFKLKNTSHSLFIDNKPVVSGGKFDFGTVSATDSRTIEIRNGSTVVASGTLYFTCLPLVQIYTESTIGSVYNLSKLSVTEPEKPDAAEVVFMNIKTRGAYASILPKKAYAVKLKEPNGSTSMDRSFFGLRDDNNWILDAAHVDPSRMRNRVSTDLWNDFAVKPYFYESEPKLVNGTRGRFVEVFLNDAWHGLYCMTEKLDRKQLKLKKMESAGNPPSITQRGGLYKASSWTTATFLGNNWWGGSLHPMSVSYDNNSETWNGFEVKYPDLGDGEPVDWKPLLDAITLSSYLTGDADFQSKVATYFDLPVFLDYYLFIELILASDNQGKNAYFSVYNQKKSPMITISPWDLDGTWGRRWDGTSTVTGPEQDFDTFLSTHEHAQNNLYLRLKALNYDNYNDKLKERYHELRDSLFSYENLMERFERYHDLFVKSGAAVREQNKWSGGDFANEIQFLSSWIQKRLAYLDNQYLGGPYTSIENKMQPDRLLIPSPVQNVLTISNLNAGDKVELISLQGSVITFMQATGAEVSVDMSRYASGVYFVKVGGNVAKIVKR
ncbi:MAG: CotH kinase family protein [Dysgonamonadaceae bacterium]|jgi:hypothetical protein|nr:CotH kinase family protein [Dysgonamonadaceae bacterium]